jgi:hypothetical protein
LTAILRCGKSAPVKSTNIAISILSTLIAGGCATSGDDGLGDGDEQGASTQYVHITDFAGIDGGAWYDLARKLNHEFDQVCGDSFCEGEYTNIVPLTFTCSVSSIRGSVRDCTWTFAAADSGVDSATARIAVDAPRYECHVKPKTTAATLLATLAGADEAISTTLPGLDVSLYDVVGECLEQPIGQTPLDVGYTVPPTYVSADSYYTSFPNQQKWRDAQAAVVAGFDNICGDTFCGGDFGDLQAMKLECAITKSTGKVKRCAWVFSGSYTQISSSGMLVPTTGSWSCPITSIQGTLSQLITVWTASSSTSAIDRPLPGTTATAYDALLDCLP